MNIRDLSEVRDSENYLLKAEKYFPSIESVQLYKDALELLDCVPDSCDKQISLFVANLKYSYARSLITRLKRINTKDFNIFCQYLSVTLFQMRKELDQMEYNEPSLYAIFKESVVRFRPQF